MTARRRAVFLDRDGVLAEEVLCGGRPRAPLSLAEFRVVPQAGREIERLRAAGLACIVVTNQPEIARGTLQPDVLQAMHELLRAEIPVAGVYVCPHDPTEGCGCHKPKPGLLWAAAAEHDIDVARSFLIGDRWRDIGAGRAAGCFSVLLRRPYSGCEFADAQVGYLSDAVDVILSRLRE